jgi:hypothetical protein
MFAMVDLHMPVPIATSTHILADRRPIKCMGAGIGIGRRTVRCASRIQNVCTACLAPARHNSLVASGIRLLAQGKVLLVHELRSCEE